MNSKTFKPMMLALAGAVALASASSAYAVEDKIIYRGETHLVAPSGAEVTCILTLAGQMDDSGVLTVLAGGTQPGEGTCVAIYTGNHPWLGTWGSGTIGLNTDSNGSGLPSTIVLPTGDQCSGVVTGISYTSTSDLNGNGLATPESITISGSLNYGGACTITGTLDKWSEHVL